MNIKEKEMNKKIFAILAIVSILSLSRITYIYSQDEYSLREKKYMLNLARQTLVWYVKHNQIPMPKAEELTGNLREKRPCFITLMKRGQGLRGCIGTFEFNRPLYKNIVDRTILAATKDSRFPSPVTYYELKDIKVEISILTKPKKLKFSNPKDLLDKLQPFEDGVILYTKYGNSTYLPQVWEQLPGKEEFLSNLCKKHGAPSSYWRTNYKNLKVEIYKAIHFAEEAYGRQVVGPDGAIVGKGGAKVTGAVSLLKEGLDFGRIFAKEGTELNPGAIATEDSAIIDNTTVFIGP